MGAITDVIGLQSRTLSASVNPRVFFRYYRKGRKEKILFFSETNVVVYVNIA